LLPDPPEPDEPPTAVAIGVAPKVRLVRGVAIADTVGLPLLETRGVVLADSVRPGLLEARGVAAVGLPTPRRAGLGINLSCSRCGTRTDPETGEEVWFFSGPFEIIGVDAGGPAARAGIEIGDLVKAIDGHGVQTDEGGRAFSGLEEGEALTLTVVKRNGQEVTVETVPEVPASTAVLGGISGGIRTVPTARATDVAVAAEARPEPSRTGVTPPAPPARADYPAPALEPPEGLPLRYTWTQHGVEVEVRGEPITVQEMRGARTLIINADGLWIRIRIPGGGEGLLADTGGR
jgi:hypothetical protein